jgi:feruloyl esterase
MDTWVERGAAPDHLVVAKLDPASHTIAFERPACEFPKFARYDGSGDPTKAESFRCSDR